MFIPALVHDIGNILFGRHLRTCGKAAMEHELAL